MKQHILVVDVRFTGMWSTLSVVRQLNRQGRDDVEVAVLAPQPGPRIRPRFYEPDVQRMAAPLGELFTAVGIRFVQGSAQRIDAADKRVEYRDAEGTSAQLDYDRLVLAAGSGVWRPASVIGIDVAFGVDQLRNTLRPEAHLHALCDSLDSPARNTVVVTDGSFTGIETTTEVPARLRVILGEKTALRVIVVDRGTAISAPMGADLSDLVAEAPAELGVEWCLGRSMTAVDAEDVTPDDGQRIETKTVVWTMGVRTSTLTERIPGKRGTQGRLHVGRNLEVLGPDDVYATDDVARAVIDDPDNHTLMTYQHAIALGRSVGNNVAADLFGVKPIPYSQMKYVTCLDLGGQDAVFIEGWDHQVRFVREEGRKVRTGISGVWIYPPAADRTMALIVADPLIPVVAQGDFPSPQSFPAGGKGCRAA